MSAQKKKKVDTEKHEDSIEQKEEQLNEASKLEAVNEGAPQGEPMLEITGSRQFSAWLAENRISLAFTTYQAGKLFFVGLQPDGRLSIHERTFNRCMGMCTNGQTIYMSSLYQLWRFDNALQPGQLHQGHDRLFVPQVGYVTGDLDIHDMGMTNDGRLVYINSLFSCLATLSDAHSFVPVWKPPFISKLAAEDRCHLNGLAIRDGKAKYVTAVSQTDVNEGWREHRRDGGIVMDIESDEVVLGGLSMPHSPRWYKDNLWVINSGTGEFGQVDMKSGKFVPVAFCPGYARGLSFVNDFAIIGLSKPRENKTFTGLALDDALKEKQVSARCGLQIVDLRTGDIVHTLNIDGIVEELYDVAILPEVVRPMALGFKTDEIRRILTVGDEEEIELIRKK